MKIINLYKILTNYKVLGWLEILSLGAVGIINTNFNESSRIIHIEDVFKTISPYKTLISVF